MPTAEDIELSGLLAELIARRTGSRVAIERVTMLTGGAASQTYAFEAVQPDGRRQRLVLRRDRPSITMSAESGPGDDLRNAHGRAGEFAILGAAQAAGLPVPPALYKLEPGDGLGAGFVMGFIEGETLARRILREPKYAEARNVMARQLGAILAGIHALPVDVVQGLKHISTAAHLDIYRRRLAQWPEPMPVMELGLRWLEERCPDAASEEHRLLHGDFRNGNLIVGPEGVRAVLDWEIAHVGDPHEDLAWICTKAWRFGGREPVGGFGGREDLYAGYEAASGRKVDRERARFWEIFSSLRWGIMCMGLAGRHLSGQVRSLELAAIGRRVSENEHDLLTLIEAEEAGYGAQ